MRMPDADGNLVPMRVARRASDGLTPRQRYQKRLQALKNERNSWMSHWRELADFIQPRKARLLSHEQNRGDRRNQNIINNTAGWGVRVLASGMMAGITSPARVWFRLTTPDPDLAEFGPVKQWLYEVESRIRMTFARSNIYNQLHQAYEALGTFGTACLYVEDDAEDVLRAYTFPLGSYALQNNARLRVDTVYRELSMTVGQLVEQFGLDAVSLRVRTDYERGDVDRWVEVVHVIEPNRDMAYGRLGAPGMAFRSCWFEVGSGEADRAQFLRESGYEDFPVLAPRWSVTGEDVYGNSPGMDALGDVKALQLLERRKAQAVDKIVTPPMRAPASLMTTRASLLPGDITYVDTSTAAAGTFEPAMTINPAAVQVLEGSIREHEGRIKTAFYADLWLMLAEQAPSDMTAREVAERHEEKMLQLGPVMERLQDELLDPLVDRTFGILLRNGDLPPPPEELQGMDLRVEYLSIMAQAQKMLGITGVERLASFAGNLAAVKPEVLDKLDFDQMVDEYGQMLGVPPALVVPDEAVEKARAARAQQAQQMQAQAAAAQTVQGAKTLSETDMGGDSALSRMLSNLGAPPPTASTTKG